MGGNLPKKTQQSDHCGKGLFPEAMKMWPARNEAEDCGTHQLQMGVF